MLKEIKEIVRNVSEIKVSYCPKIKPADRLTANCSKLVYKIFLDKWDKGTIHWREEFWLMALNQNSKVLGLFRVGEGGYAGVVVDIRIIFSVALSAGAASIVLAHNHPSGNLQPSGRDKLLTEQAKEAGQILQIPVSDHLIITEERYFSFADEGLM